MRKSISKKVRYEVFKRDSFKCQHCGKSAPDIILVVEQIKNISENGDNNILDLVASCRNCLQKMGGNVLDDNSFLAKQQKEIAKLRERIAELKMMTEWKSGLSETDVIDLIKIDIFWSNFFPEFSFGEPEHIIHLKELINKFGRESVLEAMKTSADKYFKYEKDEMTADSVIIAYSKIGGICTINKKLKDNPDIKDLYYIRGILRNKLKNGYYDEVLAFQLLQKAHNKGISIEILKQFVIIVNSWSMFKGGIDYLIEEQSKT
ncbi:MAG: HNH endonuclease [Bacteroidales bacterium]|nr:HNH endonuclease [Bacteroidales bacterium]